MRSVSWCALAALASTLVLSRAASAEGDQVCSSFREFVNSDCPLTWHGITIYGTYDVGVGWVSHGLPENGYNYEGEALVNRNGNHSQWLLAPNNLQQSG